MFVPGHRPDLPVRAVVPGVPVPGVVVPGVVVPGVVVPGVVGDGPRARAAEPGTYDGTKAPRAPQL